MNLHKASFIIIILLYFESVSCLFYLKYEDYRKIYSDVPKLPDPLMSQMFDASSKFSINGLLFGHRIDLGSFDECMRIEYPDDILGKYCIGTLATKPINPTTISKKYSGQYKLDENSRGAQKLNGSDDEPTVSYKFGICVTNQISTEKLNKTIQEFLPGINYQEDFCYAQNSKDELPTEVKITMIVLLVFVGIAVVSTIYDIIREYFGCKPVHEVAIAFSLFTNSKKLIKSSNNPSQLLCINGLKSLSMIWVVSGHTYACSNDPLFYNQLDISQFIFNYTSMILEGASIAVDTFLTISGILTVYTLLKSPDPGLKNSVKGIPMLYLHRYIRLTPALGIVILLYATSSLDYIGNGPFWYRVHEYFVPDCKDYWWSVLLYAQNYVNPRHMCMMQSWYLSVDMQLFLLSPLVLIPLRKWTKKTLLGMYGLVILGMVVPFTITYLEEIPAMIGNDNDEFGPTYYSATHARFGPYVIGMIAGYYIFHAKQSKTKKKLNPILNILLWIVILGILYSCVYVPFPLVEHMNDERLGNSIYNGFARNIWSIAISLITYLCVTGNGGPINWFLSLPIMQLIAKLSYSIYLTHLIVVAVRYFAMRTELYFSTYEMILHICSIFVTCMVVAALFSMIFESPMMTLEKIIFGRGKPKKSSEKTVAESA